MAFAVPLFGTMILNGGWASGAMWVRVLRQSRRGQGISPMSLRSLAELAPLAGVLLLAWVLRGAPPRIWAWPSGLLRMLARGGRPFQSGPSGTF
jgi:hypothetical protein